MSRVTERHVGIGFSMILVQGDLDLRWNCPRTSGEFLEGFSIEIQKDLMLTPLYLLCSILLRRDSRGTRLRNYGSS